MTRKPELPAEIRQKIDVLRGKSGTLFRDGDIVGSISASLEGWDLIPEPKSQWDYFPQSMSSSILQRYVRLNDKVNAKKWIEIAAQMYDDPNHEDHLVLMLEGESMYKLGDMDRAYYVFDRIYELYGREGFKGDQVKYLDFYLKRKVEKSG